jgi:2-iminoacetate synthase
LARFSQFFASEQSRLERLAALSAPLRQPEEIFRTAERGEGLAAEDAASLFAAARDQNCRIVIQAAANRVRTRWARKTVEFIIPVYLTSFCQNECLYCGYRQSNPIAERVRLSPEDFERQLDLILSWGHRQIELVLSDDPEFGPETVARYVATTRRKLEALGGGVVALCSPVYQQEDYVRLREAGLDWVVEWQETYHGPHFDRWHFPGSPKRNYESRLDLWDRALTAGITKIGMGVLLGLYDFRYDALAVIEHGNYLRRTYGIEPHALGIPRLKPARGVLASQKPSRFTVSDDDFRLVVSIYHMAFPTSRLFFNTRESYDLNISLVAAGDLFTVDCETLPGAYLRRHLPGQFSTHDYPPRREVKATLEQRGLACQYLAEEMPCAIAPIALATGTAIDEKRWMEQHAQVRARLQDWEMALDWLSHRGRKGGAFARISHQGGEGRGFSPAVTRPAGCRPASPPAQLAAASCAGGEAKRGRTPAISAGLKPGPSGAPGQPPSIGENSGLAPPLQGPESSPWREGEESARAAGLKPRPSGPQTKTEEPDEQSGLERFWTNGSQALERQAVDASLGEILEYFKTFLTSHCRQEESELFPAFHQDAEIASRLAAFRADHERFGVDLDKFERQMVSYGMSRDPTVLLTLGARILRELRAHLEAEELLWAGLFKDSFDS